jgi:chitin disaccharide deacetylase
MRIVAIIILVCCQLQCTAQNKEIRLIVRGDDMGYSHSGNEALIKCFKDGIEKSIEVLVPSPWFPEAVKMLKENPGVDVGIHLTLTSEWDNVKWRPLSDCPSLKDEDGYFYPFLFKNTSYPNRSVSEHQVRIEDVEKEFRAQIETGLKYIPRISHISAHMGCTSLNDQVRALSRKLAKEYKVDIELGDYQVQSVTYDGPRKTAAEKKASFLKMLDHLQPGKTYLFVDHPGIDSPELRAISHIGYEDVAEDRQGVTTLWTDADVNKIIKSKGIKLISYKDLTK